jgi:hypothetical protein
MQRVRESVAATFAAARIKATNCEGDELRTASQLRSGKPHRP